MSPQLLTAVLKRAFHALLNFDNVISDVFLSGSFEGHFGRDDGNEDPDLIAFVVDFVTGPFDFAVGYAGGDVGSSFE